MTAVPPRPTAGDPDFPYMLADTPEEFERVRGIGIPAAPDATAGDGLREVREAIARWLFGLHAPPRYWGTGTLRNEEGDARNHADAALALPALRDVLAAAEARGYERGRRDFQFAPEGDNHHNAALCPYCSPFAEAVLAAAARDAEKVRRCERLADEFDANINWREWGIGNRIRHALRDVP